MKKQIGFIIIGLISVVGIEIFFKFLVYFEINFLASVVLSFLFLSPIIVNAILFWLFKKDLKTNQLWETSIISFFIEYLYLALKFNYILELVVSNLNINW